VLFGRLFDLPADKLPAVADAMRRSISAGDVQLWFRNTDRQALLAGTEVSGALPRPEGDILMLVDANLTASKANLETTKRVDYQVERRADGRLVGHVRVEVTNAGEASLLNPLYNSFLRIFVPAGTELLDPLDPDIRQLKGDDHFAVFAQAVIVQPKEQKVVTFDYLLPERVSARDTYRLTWVRQVGTGRDRLQLGMTGWNAEADPARRTRIFERRIA
jgi:hypothetical protein